MSIYRHEANGSGIMAESAAAPGDRDCQLLYVTVVYNTAPSTSENLTVELNSEAGSNYDARLYTLDPSAASTTDVVWYPDEPLYLKSGDAVDVAYANTDLRTWHLTVTMRGV